MKIPFGHKLGDMVNFYGAPSFRATESSQGLTRPEIPDPIFLYFQHGICAAGICGFCAALQNNINCAITALKAKRLVRRECYPQHRRRLPSHITAECRRMHDACMPALESGNTTCPAYLLRNGDVRRFAAEAL